MPSIAVFHPQIVHFIVALGFVGVGLRVFSLTGRLPWTRSAAAALLIMAAIAGVAAAKSGAEAHGPLERIPGVRAAVEEHEEAGENARNAFLVIGLLELGALAMTRREAIRRGLHAASAVTGLVGAFFLFEAGEHGGALVYSYAGGPGMRSGDSTDIRRLLVSGLYNQADKDRQAGRGDDAARLTDELVRRMPGDQMTAFLAIESKLKDRKDAQGALLDLAAISAPADDPRLVIRKGLLTVEALEVLGQRDSAKVILGALAKQFPESRMVGEALKKMP